MTRPFRWPVVAGPLLVLAATAGLWWSAAQAERRVADTSDADLARHAAAFLTLLTPTGPNDSYDAPRLLSSANSLADASFWRGGIQIAMGTVALVADTIGLLPLPDSLVAALARGAPAVVATHARRRAVLVPFLSQDRHALVGWVAAWGTVERQVPSRHHLLLTLIAVLGLGSATVTLMRYTRPHWRLVAFLSALGVLGLLALSLGLSVRGTARAATDTRLLTLRRLVEIAATAAGMQQSRLPEIGIGAVSRRVAAPLLRPDDVVRGATGDAPVARIVAATPRTQGGIEFRVTPAESQLGGVWLQLLWWLAVAAAGLGVTATGGRGPPATREG